MCSYGVATTIEIKVDVVARTKVMRGKKLSILLVVAIGCGGSAAYSGGGSDVTAAAESSGGEAGAMDMGSGDRAAGPRGYGRAMGAEAGGYAESEEASPGEGPEAAEKGEDEDLFSKKNYSIMNHGTI